MQQIIERIGVLVCYRYRSNIGIYRVDWRNIGIGSMLRIDRTLLLNIICIMLTSRYGKTILSRISDRKSEPIPIKRLLPITTKRYRS